ncbi:hypothetical protein [Flavihumibacter petaseus]|uniref:Uncharacterized protein n=1 Tax=Flavihumibacter petaseus NBRC 106054 TaxID=1220578 RepID=A0A0E9N678_9BACT|nr:hypothetical protein [Flavihumibacter petaseus]GAO45308.1 hypothetical protein FPE01S_05_00050 [Flavihumibacter petaseus NBRC 106054]
MKIKSLFLLIALLPALYLSAQRNIKAADWKDLEKREDSLKVFADSMVNAERAGTRFLADSNFVKGFVRALKVPWSFQFPFDSLTTVSQLYAPDSSFRIFTWQLKKDEYMYFQKGAIQMRTKNGTLRLYPLFDVSMFTRKPDDSVRNRQNWIGALYYKIIAKTWQGKTFYTLLGFDGFTVSSNRKWMEVLSFDDNTGEPVFGGPFFVIQPDSAKKKTTVNRFHIEYKKEASTTFNYSSEKDMVIFDHLISETDEPNRAETYVPDGDFEGFEWKDGKWVQIKKVFVDVPDQFKNVDPYLGNAPAEDALLDKDGNIDEKKLEERSRKNEEKGKEKPKPKPKKPVSN